MKQLARQSCLCGILMAVMLLQGCAFANRNNRPVWNAFEASLVPESKGAFIASLPLTIPIGVGAILVDTFIAHPIQVMDDAWEDTRDVWRDIELEEHYYTEGAWFPFRVVGSPIVLVGSFLGRSFLDLPSDEQIAERRVTTRERRRAALLDWLSQVADGEKVAALSVRRTELDPQLVDAIETALDQATAHNRIRIYRVVSECVNPEIIDWTAALGDSSAVVRYHVLDELPRKVVITEDVINRLIADPDQAVRERAQVRWRR